MQNIVVTGGAGFIGSNIVEHLVRRGDTKVKVIDNLSTGHIENIKPFLDKIEFIKGSITDLELLKKVFKDVDYVLHHAAIPSVPRSVQDPITSHLNNSTGTLNVLVAAKDCGVKRVINACSSSAYGDAPEDIKSEDLPIRPKSPYAVSKISGEQYCKVFYDLYGLETVSLRYFNVFGPKQDPNSPYSAVIPLFIKSILKGASPGIFGDGLQSRDFTFIQNNINANILACTAKDAPGNVFNIACGERITLLELVESINKILNTDIKPVHQKERSGDIVHSLADISKAKKLLGYDVTVNFEEGLRKTIEWYKNDRE